MARCEAPGHEDECYIECPNGCLAYYREPDGPCVTECKTNEKTEMITLHSEFSITIKEMPAPWLGSLLTPYLDEELERVMRSSKQRVNLRLSHTNPEAFLHELRMIFTTEGPAGKATPA